MGHHIKILIFFYNFQCSNGASQCDPLSIHYIWLSQL